MRVGIERHANLAVPHEVLERLGVHARPRHVAAVGVTADVGRDVWQLDTENFIVAGYHVVEPMLPVHGHQGKSLLVQEQEPAVLIPFLLCSFRLGCVEKLSYTDIYPSTKDILRNSVSLVLFLILIKIEARYIKAR